MGFSLVETYSTQHLHKECLPKISRNASAKIQKVIPKLTTRNQPDNEKPTSVPQAKDAQAGSPQGLCEETCEVHCTRSTTFHVHRLCESLVLINEGPVQDVSTLLAYWLPQKVEHCCCDTRICNYTVTDRESLQRLFFCVQTSLSFTF